VHSEVGGCGVELFGPFPEKGLDLGAKIAGCRHFWCQQGPRPDWKLGFEVIFPFRKNESSVAAKLHHTSKMG